MQAKVAPRARKTCSHPADWAGGGWGDGWIYGSQGAGTGFGLGRVACHATHHLLSSMDIESLQQRTRTHMCCAAAFIRLSRTSS